MTSLSSRKAAAALAALAALTASTAAAAALPTGEWTCTKAAASAGPAADQDKGSGAGEALVERLRIVDASHYVLSSQDPGEAQPSDAGLYTIQGEEMVGQSGPLAQVPMHARIAAGPDAKPAITLQWASAPSLTMICQPAP